MPHFEAVPPKFDTYPVIVRSIRCLFAYFPQKLNSRE